MACNKLHSFLVVAAAALLLGSPLALAAPAAAKPAAPALKDESSLLASAVGRAMGAANATLAKAGVTSKAGLKNATAAIAAAGAGSLASKVNATVNSLDEKKDSVPIPAAAAAAAKPKSNATTIAAIGANKEAVNIGANKEAVKPKQPMPEDDDTINAPAAKNATSKNATAVTAVVAPEPAVGAATALPLPPADITAAAAAAAEPEADDEMMVTNPEGISEVEAIAGDEEDDEGPAGPIDLMTVSSRLARMRAGGNATDDDNMIMGPGLLLGPDGKPVGPTEVAEDAPSMEERLTTCTDVPPGRRHTCEQQRMMGKCDAVFMTRFNYCAETCGRAPCEECDDKAPEGGNTCEQHKSWGQCDKHWMKSGGYCKRTCGYSPCPPSAEEMKKFNRAGLNKPSAEVLANVTATSRD